MRDVHFRSRRQYTYTGENESFIINKPSRLYGVYTARTLLLRRLPFVFSQTRLKRLYAFSIVPIGNPVRPIPF